MAQQSVSHRRQAHPSSAAEHQAHPQGTRQADRSHTGRKARHRRARLRKNSTFSRWIRMGGALLIVVIAVLIWMASQATGTSTSSALLGKPLPQAHLAFPSTIGGTVSLDQYHNKKVVLFFYEGSTCGSCQQQLIGFQNDLQTIRAAGAEVIAITVDPLATSQLMARQLNLSFPVVEDTNHQLGSAVGDFHVTTGGMDMGPVDSHAVYLLDQQGTIRWVQQAVSTMSVPEADIISALKQI